MKDTWEVFGFPGAGPWHAGKMVIMREGRYCSGRQVCLAATVDSAAGGGKLCEEIKASENTAPNLVHTQM